MSSVVVIGAQWGDEGKGKIVDYLAQKADAVARYSGGSNAGHTVVVNDVAYKLRLLPSGILYKDKTCFLGNGVVINPRVVLQEIAGMHEKGVSTDNLHISDRAHVVLPYHEMLDGPGLILSPRVFFQEALMRRLHRKLSGLHEASHRKFH